MEILAEGEPVFLLTVGTKLLPTKLLPIHCQPITDLALAVLCFFVPLKEDNDPIAPFLGFSEHLCAHVHFLFCLPPPVLLLLSGSSWMTWSLLVSPAAHTTGAP